VTSTDAERTDTPPTTSAPTSPRRGAALEPLAAVVSVLLVVALGLNWLAAHLTFFGEPVDIDEEYVRNYWVLGALLAASLLATWVSAARREARGAWVWHGLVALAALAAALVFAVTTAGPVQDDPPDPPPSPSGPGAPGCHSGGDSSGCPGG
jgi:peptidoglycan/LPS O-acetylase OafA/YrhL